MNLNLIKVTPQKSVLTKYVKGFVNQVKKIVLHFYYW